MNESSMKGRVCVTGVNGFIASWLVKLLLSSGYSVNGTVRNPDDERHSELRQKVKLFKADLLDYESILSAIHGCSGVFHAASPVPFANPSNPQVEVLEPAVKGTQNVLKACFEAKVKRVVYVSSVSAIDLNPKWPKNQPMDETCWSDPQFCIALEEWYCLSKTQAERYVWEFSKQTGLDVVSVCPSLVLGPILNSNLNASTQVLVELLKEGYETLENKVRPKVDVRDVAVALLVAYENPEVEGRYICTAHEVENRVLIDKLKSLYPHYNYPKNITDVAEQKAMLSNEKLRKLGWTYRSLEETLIDSIESYRSAGLL